MSEAPSYIQYDNPAPHVARITLNRPEAANAQDTRVLYQLNDAFDRAAHDDEVKVIILAANGKHFSAGHDLREENRADNMQEFRTVFPVCGFHCAGAAAQMAREEEVYLGFSERWRNIPKPTIAAVQGKCIAGALNLIWPMDLIIAAENATFSDPVVALGACGVEYHGHTWEFGARKAKEMLFTGRAMTAQEAEQIGMVNRVVPLDQLWPDALALAHEISQFHPFALRQAKRAVNQTLDVMGQHAALQSAFDIHHTTHGNAISVTGYPVMATLDDMKDRVKEQ